jgi:GTPase SAR1 family protein
MKKIQVIGLPGAGKSTAINKYLLNTLADIQVLDIRNYKGRYRDRLFRSSILQARRSVIGESACGVQRAGFVIAVNTPIQRVYRQLLERDKELDEDYLSLLSTQMVHPDYTIGMPEDLPELLRTLLEG